MPATEPTQSVNLTTQLIALAAGMAGVILSLVAFITHWFKETLKDQQGQLTEGAEEFTNLKLENEKLKGEIKRLDEWNVAQGKELDGLHKETALLRQAIVELNTKLPRLAQVTKSEIQKVKAADEVRDSIIKGLQREQSIHHDFILRIAEKHFHQHGESIPLCAK